jgi:hypothetical protein
MIDTTKAAQAFTRLPTELRKHGNPFWRAVFSVLCERAPITDCGKYVVIPLATGMSSEDAMNRSRNAVSALCVLGGTKALCAAEGTAMPVKDLEEAMNLSEFLETEESWLAFGQNMTNLIWSILERAVGIDPDGSGTTFTELGGTPIPEDAPARIIMHGTPSKDGRTGGKRAIVVGWGDDMPSAHRRSRLAVAMLDILADEQAKESRWVLNFEAAPEELFPADEFWHYATSRIDERVAKLVDNLETA